MTKGKRILLTVISVLVLCTAIFGILWGISGGELSDTGIKAADVDKDGTPSIADSLLILKYIINLVSELPYVPSTDAE